MWTLPPQATQEVESLNPLIDSYWEALLLTLVVEGLIILLLSPKETRVQLLGVSALLNLFTHPLAYLAAAHYWLPFLQLEALVLIAEAAGYALVGGVKLSRGALLAAAANIPTALLSFLM